MNLYSFTIITLFTPVTAFAYLDPGTGSIIIQSLVGVLAFIAVSWGMAKDYIRSLFFKTKNKEASLLDGVKTNVTSEQTQDAQELGGTLQKK